MNKHLYPAIFHEEDNGFWVEFPGLEGCVTQGDTFEQAYEMAIEALGLYLESSEGNFSYPAPMKLSKANIDNQSYIVMVEFDELEYLKKVNNQSVKKTLTIPKWLDVLAIRNNINFSKVLQNALINSIVKK